MDKLHNQLARDYRMLLDFIYNGDDWKEFQSGRVVPHKDYRHIIRVLILEKRGGNLRQLARAEGKVLGKKPTNHATIINSTEVFENDLKTRYKSFIGLVKGFYEMVLKNEELMSQTYNMKMVRGVLQIHLHFENGGPSKDFIAGLKQLIDQENEVTPHG